MARPKQLNNAKVVPIIFEGDLYEQLKLESSRMSISVSSLVRQIVMHYLNSNISAKEGSPEDPPSDEMDPLTELDLQSLIQKINSYEKYIEKFAKDKASWIEWINQSKDDFSRKNRQEKYDKWYKKEYNYVYEIWYSLRDKFERLRGKIPKAKAREISKKLADLKKKIDNL
jgi:hypothetical protein